MPGLDIRDPILAPIGGRLFLYALTNAGFYAIPSGTVLATSDDGAAWSTFEPVGPPGWLFWRMRAHPTERAPGGEPVWYASAYWKDHGESILLRSPDGRAFERVGDDHRGDANDETEIAFLPRADGSLSERLVATCRLEITPDNLVGPRDAATLLAFADPPYTEWSRERTVRTQVTRLDGPVAFADGGRLFFVARAQPGARRWPVHLGSAFARKRTALWWLDPGREAPDGRAPARRASSGSPTFRARATPPTPASCSAGGALFADYYTSRIDRDYAWLLGMILPTEIRMARVPLADASHGGGAGWGTAAGSLLRSRTAGLVRSESADRRGFEDEPALRRRALEGKRSRRGGPGARGSGSGQARRRPGISFGSRRPPPSRQPGPRSQVFAFATGLGGARSSATSPFQPSNQRADEAASSTGRTDARRIFATSFPRRRRLCAQCLRAFSST